ncbi:MAG: formate acetyltransferase [Clostridiales bacterium]|jgi:formate C-acetyltransferase|nr:formate acetyltransferase [Clostridiales bacterium]
MKLTNGAKRYRDRIDALTARKLEATADKRKTIKYIDSDDSGMILPPERLRKVVEAISGSGMPITDVTLNDVELETRSNGGFYGPKEVGSNFRLLMRRHPAHVDADSALTGAIMTNFLSYRKESWNPDYPYDELKPLHEKYKLVPPIGAAQHFCQDLSIGLELGWKGLEEKIGFYQKLNISAESAELYEGLLAVIDGIEDWILRNAELAKSMAHEEPDPLLKGNLLSMASISEKVSKEPPETFHEACQWILYYQMAARIYNGSGSLGRLDLLLAPFYHRDSAMGILTDEDAVFLLACLLLRDASYIQIGGYGPNGEDTSNRLSYLILEAVHETKIPSNIGLAVGKGLNRDLLKQGVLYQFQDKTGNPRFIGMDSVIEGFMRNGYDYQLASSRTNSGCHWLSIPGREYSLNDCTKVNFGAVFEAAFEEMTSDGLAPSLERLWGLFCKHLESAIFALVRGFHHHFQFMRFSMPELIIDLLCHGPIEKGLDASGGGVEFYNFCIDGAAIAVVADSFATIKKVIEEDKRYTFADLSDFLKANWEGPDAAKARHFFAGCPKFGIGGSDADYFAAEISKAFTEKVKSFDELGHIKFIPGLFSWANTIPMGKDLGASPNGRLAGQPISHGANPNPGFRQDGAATAMSSAIASVQSGYGNTAPMQIEIEPSISAEEGGVEIIMALIEDHFEKGGTLINLNVLDAEKIRKANESPELYPDLVVRVTGFSAYFSILSPDFRKLVVDRVLDRQMA